MFLYFWRKEHILKSHSICIKLPIFTNRSTMLFLSSFRCRKIHMNLSQTKKQENYVKIACVYTNGYATYKKPSKLQKCHTLHCIHTCGVYSLLVTLLLTIISTVTFAQTAAGVHRNSWICIKQGLFPATELTALSHSTGAKYSLISFNRKVLTLIVSCCFQFPFTY